MRAQRGVQDGTTCQRREQDSHATFSHVMSWLSGTPRGDRNGSLAPQTPGSRHVPDGQAASRWGAGEAAKKRRKKRRREVLELEEDDYDLLEENQVKVGGLPLPAVLSAWSLDPPCVSCLLH